MQPIDLRPTYQGRSPAPALRTGGLTYLVARLKQRSRNRRTWEERGGHIGGPLPQRPCNSVWHVITVLIDRKDAVQRDIEDLNGTNRQSWSTTAATLTKRPCRR